MESALFRDDNIIQLNLQDCVKSLPRSLINLNSCAQECVLYALFNTVTLQNAASKKEQTLDHAMEMMTLSALERDIPYFDIVNYLWNAEINDPVDILLSFDVDVKFLLSDNFLSSFTFQNVLDKAGVTFSDDMIVLRFNSPGTIMIPDSLKDSHFMTALMIYELSHWKFLGRRQNHGQGDTWYFYDTLIGVVPLSSDDAIACLESVSGQPGLDFIAIYETKLPLARAYRPAPRESTPIYAPELIATFVDINSTRKIQSKTIAGTNIPKINKTFTPTNLIRNLGVTCHFNACLQLLARIDGVDRVQPSSDIVVKTLHRLHWPKMQNFVEIDRSVVLGITPNKPYPNGNALSHQQDAFETFQFATAENAIAEFVLSKTGCQYTTTFFTPCVRCGRISPPRTDLINVITLDYDIPMYNEKSMQKIIDATFMTEPETLSPDNILKKTCSCGARFTVNMKRASYDNFNEYIVLSVKTSFNNDTHKSERPLQKFLPASRFYVSDSNGIRTNFTTVAVVLHQGTEATSGHYVTAVRTKVESSDVLIYDDLDDNIKLASFEDIRTARPGDRVVLVLAIRDTFAATT